MRECKLQALMGGHVLMGGEQLDMGWFRQDSTHPDLPHDCAQEHTIVELPEPLYVITYGKTEGATQ